MKDAFILTTFISFTYVSAVNYCSLHCVDPFGSKVENTACKCSISKKKCGPNPKLLPPEGDLKTYIVELHNEYREKLASGQEKFPAAANIIALAYDDNLQHTAQCWTIQCVMGHDKCRRTEQFEFVGQNFFWSSDTNCGTEEMLKVALKGWYDEVTSATESCLKKYDGCSGHFTQMVWAETTHVGCGRVSWSNGCTIVCNYGPAGNKLAAPTYEPGAPTCETDPKFTHLCRAKDPIVNPDNPVADGRSILTKKMHLLCLFHFLCFYLYNTL